MADPGRSEQDVLGSRFIHKEMAADQPSPEV